MVMAPASHGLNDKENVIMPQGHTMPMVVRVSGFVLLVSAVSCFGGSEETPVSGIQAFHWHGQTFLQWEEREMPGWATFNVYRSDKPITSVDAAGVECLARRIIPRSGRSFYCLKKMAFKRPLPCNERRGTV